jgi:hypothetical protein
MSHEEILLETIQQCLAYGVALPEPVAAWRDRSEAPPAAETDIEDLLRHTIQHCLAYGVSIPAGAAEWDAERKR